MIFKRFAKEARSCVEAAVEEARLMGHDSVGDEDLLLGILSTDKGEAAEALSSLGITLEESREESERTLSDALSSIGISLEEIRQGAGDTFDMSLPEDRKIPFSPRSKKALEAGIERSFTAGRQLYRHRTRLAGDIAQRRRDGRQDTGWTGGGSGSAGGTIGSSPRKILYRIIGHEARA